MEKRREEGKGKVRGFLKKNWNPLTAGITVIVGGIGLVSAQMFNLTSRIDGMMLLQNEMMRDENTRFDQAMAQQSARSDKLYEMFIELVKDGRK